MDDDYWMDIPVQWLFIMEYYHQPHANVLALTSLLYVNVSET